MKVLQPPTPFSPSQARNPTKKLLGTLLDSVIQTTVDECPLYEAAGLPRGTEVDVVISGGGLRGYYCVGSSVVLNALVEAHGLKICRMSGASAGAWNVGKER